MFNVQYAVPMHCESCVESVSEKLKQLNEVSDFSIDLKNQQVLVTGTAPPSQIVESMQDIGRDAFVRGSGEANTSAVAILETSTGEVGGLVRLISSSNASEPGWESTLFDITTKPAERNASVAVLTYGDISRGAESAGPVLHDLGQLGANGRAFVQAHIPLSSMIGRSVAVHGKQELVGVIARSAGLWENDKTVCSCSGQTLWEEREQLRAKY